MNQVMIEGQNSMNRSRYDLEGCKASGFDKGCKTNNQSMRHFRAQIYESSYD